MLRVGGFVVGEHPGQRSSSGPEVAVECPGEPDANVLGFHRTVLQPGRESVTASESGLRVHVASRHHGFHCSATTSVAMFKTAQPPMED